MQFDAAVIGAGVIGALIARELSMLDLSVCVIEAEADLAFGATRANSGIVHAGYDALEGTKKALFNVRGNALMQQTAKELDVPYKNCGSVVVAFDDSDEQSLKMLQKRAQQNGVYVNMLSGNEIRKKEPHLSEKITAALYAPSAGIICPFGLAIAAMENAAENGSVVLRGSRVTHIERKGEHFDITAGENHISARFLLNAAGVFADEISRMAGGEQFSIRARKGEYLVFDKKLGERTSCVVFGAPSNKGKGIVFAPTVRGNMIAGPTAEFTAKDDTSTSKEGIEAVLNGVKRYIPKIDTHSVITTFSGLRAVPETHDFIIEASKSAPGLVNVAGIESPGLTSAPAIAQHVREMLFGMGVKKSINPNAKRTRKAIESFADAGSKRRRELIKKDARYANVICRCENVTETEIVNSIKRPCGAVTVDGVKLRTGAGFGRCQGGFCINRVMDILARELNEDLKKITKSGEGSNILSHKTKEETQ